MCWSRFIVVFVGVVSLVAAWQPTQARSLSFPSTSVDVHVSDDVATVTIRSDPSGASVTIDGVFMSVTPLDVVVRPGSVRVSIAADEPFEEYDLYKVYSTIWNIREDTAVDVWIDRTTAEEQLAQQARARTYGAGEDRAALLEVVDRSSWSYSNRVDAISDANNSVAFSYATSWPRYYDDANLYIVCSSRHDDGVYAGVYADTYLGNSDLRVDWRVDAKPAVVGERWRPSTEGTAVLNLATKTQWFRALSQGESLFVRIYDYNDTPHDYTFALDGFREAVALLECYQGTAFLE